MSLRRQKINKMMILKWWFWNEIRLFPIPLLTCYWRLQHEPKTWQTCLCQNVLISTVHKHPPALRSKMKRVLLGLVWLCQLRMRMSVQERKRRPTQIDNLELSWLRRDVLKHGPGQREKKELYMIWDIERVERGGKKRKLAFHQLKGVWHGDPALWPSSYLWNSPSCAFLPSVEVWFDAKRLYPWKVKSFGWEGNTECEEGGVVGQVCKANQKRFLRTDLASSKWTR